MPSVQLLKLLAEAADGYRTGGNIWLVACSDDSQQEVHAFETDAEAKDFAEDHGSPWTIYGPYTTPAERADSWQWRPQSVQITLQQTGGQATRTVTYQAEDVDAIFLSESSCEKFLWPYYAKLKGLDTTVALREELEASGVLVLVHDKPSYPTMGAPPPDSMD